MTHSRTLWIGGTTAIVALAVAVLVTRGESARSPRERSAAGVVADSGAIDPEAIAALESMGKYLRTLKTIDVHAVVTHDEVQTDGQKVQTTSNVDVLGKRPDRLRAEVTNDRQPRIFYYDGKKFTLWAPVLRFYTTIDAPSTIGELADKLEDRYNVDLPLVDLFRWGTKDADTKDITSATDLGPSMVDGVTCEQYLFRQEGVDWQLWIQRGDFPLPKKIVITTLTDEARPQHTSVWTWNLAPSFNDAAFVFTPPSDAKVIPFTADLADRLSAKAKGAAK
jgi:hypothetical protein